MEKVIKYLVVVFVVIGLHSCSSDDNVLDEDVASTYVGEWSYFDQTLGKDASSVTIEKISDSEIKIFGFHNLGTTVYTKFKVYNDALEITSTKVDGLAISGSGTSNYKHDQITVLYTVDGDDYEAKMSKLESSILH